MEAGAYVAKNVVEAAVGASVAIAKPTMPLTARWKRIETDLQLPRSSHSLSMGM